MELTEKLPNPEPRPPGEEQQLLEIWRTPTGWRRLTAVNNTVIGVWYIGAALMFFVLAGALALVMRTQLAVPENDLVTQNLYNQLFTTHGTTMMFLFAVPAMEALGVMLLPQMLAARDLPFPRLSAFAIWAYIVGGTVFFSTIFYDLAPAGGWFMNPPLTLTEYSPGNNADFWLLGIGFIEISAIAGAIEIIVGVLRTRPPGMTLGRMPIFAWAMLIFSGMIVVAFPAVILATMLLELERAFGWPFFSAALGGDPLLWQHLFWFFGHPEVYIIFLPAAGLVSMIVPTIARTPLVGYPLIVVALVATGFFSFGLWVHHMFTTGIPALSLSFFSAASMAVAIPSGLQIFAWIATLAAGKRIEKLGVPGLFVFGMLAIFVIGGLTGVMVAMVPFDWQAHDSYFIVAHLHYVLIGGMVFPLFATFYYWAPLVSRTPLSPVLGKWVFWLMFTGMHVTFLPMHVTGLAGMPRRVWTYADATGWGPLNLLSTAGSYLIAAGVALFLVDLLRNFRAGRGGGADNPWGAGTLEWLPNDVYSTRSIPQIASREPLWDVPGLAEEVRNGHHFLPNAPTGRRETLVSSPVDAVPQYVIQMPGPSWSHFVAAVFTAACFLLLTIKVVVPALLCAVIAIAACLRWAWELDKGPEAGPVDIGGGYRVPVYISGPDGHGWWAMVILMLVAGSLFTTWIFSYLYLWTVSPEVWPAASALPAAQWPGLSALLLIASIPASICARRSLAKPGQRNFMTPLWIALSAALLVAALVIEGITQWQHGVNPTHNSHDAMVFMAVVLNGQLAFAVVIMSAFVIARHYTWKLDRIRCATLENTQLLSYYTVAQALIGLLLIHGFPRAM